MVATHLNTNPNKAMLGLKSTLDEGLYSTGIVVSGDSTGFDDFMWVRQMGLLFAARYPNLRVQYNRFDATTQDYGVTSVLQAGASGERSIRFTGVKGRYQPAADVGSITSDLDLAVKVSLDDWSAAAQQSLISRFNFSGGDGFNFYETFSLLRLEITDNAGVQEEASSTVGVGFANGSVNWVRATFEAATGNVKFYTGSDGVTWTQLGATVTLARRSVRNVAGKDYEIGGMNGLSSGGPGSSQVITGNIYDVKIRQGIGGPIMNARPIESWGSTNADGTSLAGSPTLYIDNGSIVGADLAYLTNSTRLPMAARNVQPALVFLSCSKNDLAALSKSQLSDVWDGWLAALKARMPEAAFCMITQNPSIAPAGFIPEHGTRVRRLMTWAERNNVSAVDTYAAFVNDSRGVAALTNVDGIHPNSDGGLLQAQTVFNNIICGQ